MARLFQEAGELERDVGHLRRHAMAQRSLIQHLAGNQYSSIAAALPENSCKEEVDCSLNLADVVVVVDQLDVLLFEHRMDQTMDLLEKEGEALEKMQSDDGGACPPARVIASAMSALSARKARVADRLAALADNPRTPRHELLRALAGLCSLGDGQRANHLLFKFHRSGGRRVDDQTSCRSSSSSQRNYIKELACAVFSSIHDASRSFLALHGRPSPELRRWAREEVEDLGVAFREYVSSVPEAGEGLAMAVEAAGCAASCCSSMLGLWGYSWKTNWSRRSSRAWRRCSPCAPSI